LKIEAFGRTLFGRQENAALAEFLPQYLVLCSQGVNRILLVPIKPTSEDVD
jgi:hypothetical protein